jgi:predicted PurR-regulated permease PerM
MNKQPQKPQAEGSLKPPERRVAEKKGWALPSLTPWQLVQGTLAVTAVLLVFWFLFRFHAVILLLLAAIIISTALQLAVNRLHEHGLPKWVGVLAVYGVVAVLIALLLWWSVPALVDQGTAVAQTIGEVYQSVRENLQNVPNILIRRLGRAMPAYEPGGWEMLSDLPVSQDTNGGGDGIAGDEDTAVSIIPEDAPPLWQQIQIALESVISLVVVFALAFYWTLEAERIKQGGLLLVPMAKRQQVSDLIKEIEDKLGGYIIGQGLLMLSIAVLSFGAYALLGLPQALLLAVFAGVMEAVPIVGPFLGAVPAVIIGFSISPSMGLWVIVIAVLIQQIENNLLVPRVMNRTIGVRPLVTLLALLALSSLFGIWGALIALPLAAVLHLLFDHSVQRSTDEPPSDATGRDRRSVLLYQTKELVQDIRQKVRDKESEPTTEADYLEDEVEAIAQDLAQLLGNGNGNGEATGALNQEKQE